jgi:hypothetical protein
MSFTSTRTLNFLAAFVWLAGALVLLIKSQSLVLEAIHLEPGWLWPGLATGSGLLIGVLKGKFIFSHSCHKNISRIASLSQPRLWQFFSPRFFLLLALMITIGATLSRLAEGQYLFLLGVAALDLTIAVALLSSSIVFWHRQAFTK